MKYRVTWAPDAFRRLVHEWTDAGRPQAAIEAFDAIEQLLEADAELQGESRPDGRRILLSMPLGVIFRATPETATVLIVDAWMFRSRGT